MLFLLVDDYKVMEQALWHATDLSRVQSCIMDPIQCNGPIA